MSPHRSTAILLASLLLISALVGGCAPPQPTRVGKISIAPSTIVVGGTATLTVDAQGNDLKFKWTATRGTLSSSTTPSVLYTAPDSPGPATVTVEVSGKGGTMVQSITIQVVTSPSTPTLTPSPTPVAPPSATPTRTPTTPPKILPKITNVADGDELSQTITLIGTYPEDLRGDLWVFVIPPNGLLYPQSKRPCDGEGTPHENGRWEIQVGLGSERDVGQPFIILLAVADAQGNQAIVSALKTWCQKNDFSGLTMLPLGVTETQRVNVIHGSGLWGPAPNISNAALPGRVTIASLTNDSRVASTMTLSGTYGPGITGTLWALVSPYYGKWYPQSTNSCFGIHTKVTNEQWSVPVIFGDEQDTGKPFDVVVVLADAESNRFFSEKQREWCLTKTYPGLWTFELPKGITEKARLRVYRLSKPITLLRPGAISNWTPYNDNTSTLSTRIVPGKSGKALAISYTLKPDSWVGVATPITPSQWSEAAKVGFTYRGEGVPNTIELKFIYRSGAVFSVNTSPTATATSDWTSFEAWVSDLACWKDTPGCLRGNEKFEWSQVDRIDLAVSNKPGGKSGSGSVVIDEVYILK